LLKASKRKATARPEQCATGMGHSERWHYMDSILLPEGVDRLEYLGLQEFKYYCSVWLVGTDH
jgi:hypothetical protein